MQNVWNLSRYSTLKKNEEIICDVSCSSHQLLFKFSVKLCVLMEHAFVEITVKPRWNKRELFFRTCATVKGKRTSLPSTR